MKSRPSTPWTSQAAVLLSLVVIVCWQAGVQAYVDPGNGSMVVQLLLGGVAGVAVAVRVYWRRLTQHFRSKPPGAKSQPEA